MTALFLTRNWWNSHQTSTYRSHLIFKFYLILVYVTRNHVTFQNPVVMKKDKKKYVWQSVFASNKMEPILHGALIGFWKNLANVPQLDHPADFRITSSGVPAMAAALVDAALVLWAPNLVVSMPASLKTFLIHCEIW